GTTATVFMPVSAPLPKVAATRAYGASVHLLGSAVGGGLGGGGGGGGEAGGGVHLLASTVDEALVAAREWEADTGSVLVHPFDHPDIIAGQGTVGLEILEQCPDVRTVVVSTGGGGVVSGIGVAIKALRPDVQVVAVQAEEAA